MRAKQIAAALAIVGVTAVGSAAHATTITNLTGTLSPFDGFDWVSNGTAFSTGFAGQSLIGTCVTNCTFTMTFYASAVGVNKTGGGYLTTAGPTGALYPNMDGGATAISGYSYMYTTVATVDETIDSCTATSCTFSTTGGSFDIYYNTTKSQFANVTTGLNFAAGTAIISGTVNAKGTADTFDNTGQSPTFNLTGLVTYTDSAYINPALLDSTFSTTLQIGPNTTSYTKPTTFNGTAFASDQFVFQADGNQNFRAVPEPKTLLLFGAALAALGLATRRRGTN